MSLTAQVLLALVAGFAVGLPLAGTEAPAAVRLLGALEPLGLLFVNAIRMTVIPLVVSSLIVGVASAPDQRTVGRLGARALLLFVVAVAALPAMLEAVRGTLGLPPAIGSMLIPLASTLFRAGAGIGQTVGVCFIARLYGVDLGAAQLLTIALTAVVTSFSVPGIPGGSIVVMVPILSAAGIPVEGIGILLGADTIPDMFRTTTNVTGHLTASVVLARGERA